MKLKKVNLTFGLYERERKMKQASPNRLAVYQLSGPISLILCSS